MKRSSAQPNLHFPSLLVACCLCLLSSPVSAAAQERRANPDPPEPPGTIAIAASGPNAGLAVFRALEEAEKVGSGSIGGDAYFVAMLPDGTICTYANFGRGGTGTLFIEGEETGVPPPPEIGSAPLAGIVSTGPRGPYEPPAEPCESESATRGDSIGFVVGHRLPDSPGRDGRPVDEAAFRLLKEGLDAQSAVDSVIGANPRVDAGLIAVDAAGSVGMRNSKLVDRRPDYAHARGEDRPTGAVVETILNEIHPPQAVGQLVVNVALETMTGAREPDFQIVIRAGSRIEHAQDNRVVVDDERVATRITTDVREHLEGRVWAAVPYILSEIVQDGEVIGYTVIEALGELEDGVIQSLSGQPEMKVWVKEKPRHCEYRNSHLTVCEVPTRRER